MTDGRSVPEFFVHQTSGLAAATLLLATTVRVHDLRQRVALGRGRGQRLADSNKQIRDVRVFLGTRFNEQRTDLVSVRASLRRGDLLNVATQRRDSVREILLQRNERLTGNDNATHPLLFQVALVACDGDDDVVRAKLLELFHPVL